jgi:hypothetical protein
MRLGGWHLGALLAAAACSNGGQARDGGSSGSVDAGAPSQATDTNPSNPHVTTRPPISPNGASAPGPGGQGAAGSGGAAGARSAGTAGAGGAGGGTGLTGFGGTSVTSGFGGTSVTSGFGGTSVTTGSGGTTGTVGAAGAVMSGPAGSGASGAAGATAAARSWPTVDCVGGPCAAPNVCVNLDFLFVACVPCGGNDQVCCPPFAADDPFAGTCDAGLTCAPNPNFKDSPPLDLVREVCQDPASPPPADGRLNHERLILFP